MNNDKYTIRNKIKNNDDYDKKYYTDAIFKKVIDYIMDEDYIDINTILFITNKLCDIINDYYERLVEKELNGNVKYICCEHCKVKFEKLKGE